MQIIIMNIPKLFCIVLIFAYIFLNASFAYAQLLETVRITSSPNPLGSGARALGVGNAFIAIADDATAASWNPGGLMQLEKPEISLVLYFPMRVENYSSESNPEAASSNFFANQDINYFSAAYPFALWGKNMIVSLNYQRLYDMQKKLNFNLRNIYTDSTNPLLSFDLTQQIDYEATGGIKAFAPAYAIQVIEDLSIGFTLNIWQDALGRTNGWKEKYSSRGEGTFSNTQIIETVDMEDKFTNFRGLNFNIGLLWNATEMITFGAVYKSAFTGKMDHDFRFQSTQQFPQLGITTPGSFEMSDTMKLHLPASYGAGLSFRFSDEFTIAFDVYRAEWSNYFFKAEDGSKTSPIDGSPRSQSNIKNTTQIHAGAEYLFILEKTVIPIRGGLFFDPEPAEGSPEEYYGLSVGTGVSIKDLILDVAYRYRWGNGVEGDSIGIPNTTADVRQHTIYVSAIYHF